MWCVGGKVHLILLSALSWLLTCLWSCDFFLAASCEEGLMSFARRNQETHQFLCRLTDRQQLYTPGPAAVFALGNLESSLSVSVCVHRATQRIPRHRHRQPRGSHQQRRGRRPREEQVSRPGLQQGHKIGDEKVLFIICGKYM